MRVQLIGHFKPCITDIYLHIVARMHGRLYPHAPVVPPLGAGAAAHPMADRGPLVGLLSPAAAPSAQAARLRWRRRALLWWQRAWYDMRVDGINRRFQTHA